MNARRTFQALSLPLFTTMVIGASACATTPPDSEHASQAALGAVAPSFGSARAFAVLGGSTVTNTGATTIGGDLGVSPGLAIIGFPPGLVSGGTIHAGDAAALQAQTDVGTAFDALAAQACSADLSGQDLGGLTLTPGVYCFSSSAQLTGALVLDAAGRSDAVFVFKVGTTLTTASSASVRVINGGNDCGVFWQVGSSATLGTGTAFAGSVVALASITLTTGAKVSGRTLARTGAVTLDTSAVALPLCATTTPASDGGAGDAGPMPDSGIPQSDAGTPPVDAGAVPDASAIDAGSLDASPIDADVSDTGTSDAAPDAACCVGTVLCGGACIDLSIDVNNCGACGTVCGLGEACTLGVCAICK